MRVYTAPADPVPQKVVIEMSEHEAELLSAQLNWLWCPLKGKLADLSAALKGVKPIGSETSSPKSPTD